MRREAASSTIFGMSDLMLTQRPLWLLRGRMPYLDALEAMQAFTAQRGPGTPDEIWLVEHAPVFTQGIAGRAAHVLNAGDIPVVQSNRGGQVTYHGPGQVVAYPLIDLRRLRIYVKEYVYRLEQAAIQTLDHFGILGRRVPGAPGVYVNLADPRAAGAATGPALHPFQGLGKIAALGVKVSNHCAYHGLALNVAMDLAPYLRIDPCGYAGLAAVDMATLGVDADWATVAAMLGDRLAAHLSS
jgi:lipoyl(octanoyl) transferase